MNTVLSRHRMVASLLIVTSFLMSAVKAQTSITLGAGLATPNDQINNVYNSSTVNNGTGGLWNTLRESTKLGYDLTVRLRFPLSDNVQFNGGVSFNRFPQTNISLMDSAGHPIQGLSLSSTQNIIPISAGIDYFLIHSIVSPYVSAELQYNYIENTVDYNTGSGVAVPLNLNKTPVDSRVGAAFGGGVMINLAITSLNLDVRYHMVNLIGRTGDEAAKSYLTLNAGVCFGWK